MAGDAGVTALSENEAAGDAALSGEGVIAGAGAGAPNENAGAGLATEAGAGAPNENFAGAAGAVGGYEAPPVGFTAADANGSALGAFDAVGGYEAPPEGFAAAVANGRALGAFDAVGGYEAPPEGFAAAVANGSALGAFDAVGGNAGGALDDGTAVPAAGFAPKLKPDAPIPVDAVPPNENVAGAGLATGAAADEPNAVAPPPKEKPFAVIPPLAAVFTVAAAAAGAAVADGFGFGVSQAMHFADAATFLIEHAGHFHSPACSLPKSPKPDDGAAVALGFELSSSSSSSSSSLSANTHSMYQDTNSSLCTRPSFAHSLFMCRACFSSQYVVPSAENRSSQRSFPRDPQSSVSMPSNASSAF